MRALGWPVLLGLLAAGSSGALAASGSGPRTNVRVDLVGQWGGYCGPAAIENGRAYVGVGSSLHVLDITDPARPVRLGQVLLPDVPWEVEVSQGYAYMPDGRAGLQIADVSDPGKPTWVGGCDLPDPAQCVAVRGSYAYVGTPGTLEVVDVSNPTAPKRVAQRTAGAYDIALAGNHAYVGRGPELRIFDISKPAEPVLVGYCWVYGFDGGGVAVQGAYAYVANGENLQIVDVSDPRTPRRVAALDTGGWQPV